MHEPIVEGLEEYLQNGAARRPLPAFEAHLAVCPECREEVAALKEQSVLLRKLRAPREMEIPVGFYARVMDRIDAQRSTSFWSVFLEPSFSRRLAWSSLALILLCGSYMATTPIDDPAPPPRASVLSTPVPVNVAAYSADGEQSRDAVLVDLGSYNEAPSNNTVPSFSFSEQ